MPMNPRMGMPQGMPEEEPMAGGQMGGMQGGEPGMDDGVNVTPEEQQRFDELVDRITVMLDEPNTYDKMMAMIASHLQSGQAAQGFAMAIVATLDRLENEVGQLDDDYLINLAEHLVGYLIEQAVEAGLLQQPDEDLIEQILATAVQLWMQEHQDRVQMDDESMAMVQEAAGGMGGQPEPQQPMGHEQPTGLLGGV